MADNHANNIDPRPKRRKTKDNPYTLRSIGIDSDHPKFYVSFRDGAGVVRTEEISKELFELFNQFELDDLAQLNEADRHYEQSELTNEALHLRAVVPQMTAEDMIFQMLDNQNLHKAIANLPDIQRRRVQMYYFDSLTFDEIAACEGCKYQQIQKSIERAKKKIKKFLS